jgi:hypothetical protein
MAVANRNKSSYGFSDAVFEVFNPPIISQRDPTTADQAPLGTIWVNRASSDAFVLTSVAANVATWISIAGGGGVFSSLTVNPGPTNITGLTNINTAGAGVTNIGVGGTGPVNIGNATGNTDIAAGDLTVSSGDLIVTLGNVDISAGDLNIDNGDIIVAVGDITATLGTVTAGAGLVATAGGVNSTGNVTMDGGVINIAVDNSANSITIGAGTVGRTIDIGTSAAPHDVTVGTLNTTASTTIQAGTIGIALNATTSNVSVSTNTQTAASPTATVAINSRVGQAVFTGFTTANGAAEVFTITNTEVTSSSTVLLTVSNSGSNDAQMTLYRLLLGVNSMDITTFNNGAAALNGTVYIAFWVLD